MRKRINILFVALATFSVVYGMVLKYSPDQDAVINNDLPAVSAEEVVNYDDGVADMDALNMSNPD